MLQSWLVDFLPWVEECFSFQSTPVGSLQTGQEVIVSPNRERHQPANKVTICVSVGGIDRIEFRHSVAREALETQEAPEEKSQHEWLSLVASFTGMFCFCQSLGGAFQSRRSLQRRKRAHCRGQVLVRFGRSYLINPLTYPYFARSTWLAIIFPQRATICHIIVKK